MLIHKRICDRDQCRCRSRSDASADVKRYWILVQATDNDHMAEEQCIEFKVDLCRHGLELLKEKICKHIAPDMDPQDFLAHRPKDGIVQPAAALTESTPDPEETPAKPLKMRCKHALAKDNLCYLKHGDAALKEDGTCIGCGRDLGQLDGDDLEPDEPKEHEDLYAPPAEDGSVSYR